MLPPNPNSEDGTMIHKSITHIWFRGLILMMITALLFWTPGTGAAGPTALEIDLAEAVQLALRHNRSVKSSFMDRVVQKFDLEVELDKFNTDVDFSAAPTVSGTFTRNDRADGNSRSTGWGHAASISASKSIRTGGTFTFSWDRSDDWSDTDSSAQDRSGTNTWSAAFTQPLLQGAGIELNTASLAEARMNEQSSLLDHRDNIINVVNETIYAFRTYARTARELEISKASLARSRQNLEMNRLLVEMRRLPANEVIQTELDVANQELAFEGAMSELDNARLELLKVLDMDQATQITPREETDLQEVRPDYDTCLAIAFENRADYLEAQMDIKRARISLMEAEDNMKWTLDLTSGASISDENSRGDANTTDINWEVGLSLEIPLYGDLTREQTLLSAENSLKQAELDLEETRESIILEVRDGVREVGTRLKRVGMARRSRELAEKTLAVEKEKLAAGRTTTFQVVSFQNDLVDSLNTELDARVEYLNALTGLDTTLATTLDTWKVDYNAAYDKWPGK